MNIAFFEVNDWEEPFLKKRLDGHHFLFFNESLTQENVNKAKECEIISIFIYSKITRETIDRLPNLKMITTRSTGFDHIDTDYCKQKNIVLCNVPSYGENTVAEHTFALILSLSRNIHKSYVRTLRGDYTIEGLKGFDLKGKTIGVIGAGRIGLHVIKIAKGFGMDVLAYDVNKNTFLEEVLGFRYVALEELLSSSDIISLNVPHNKFTHHLINENNIAKIKKGSILINTSRGRVIETRVLYDALKNKRLSGAGLDVIEDEELIKEENQLLHDESKLAERRNIVTSHDIFKMDNVVYTPHIAFYSQEALERILETTALNIREFVSGKKNNIIN